MLRKWGEWAISVDGSQLNDGIVQRESDRHQLLANSCDAAHDGSLSSRLKAIYSVSKLPHQIGGVVGPAMVTALWAEGENRHSRDIIAASFVGAELASRVGLCTLFCEPLHRQSIMTMTAVIGALGKFRGLTALEMSKSLALGLSFAPRLSPAMRREHMDTFWLVAQSVAGFAITQALDNESTLDVDVPEALSGNKALTGPWIWDFNHLFSAQLLLADTPGDIAGQVAVQSVFEILNRHVKAADKRLRADQIQSIDITGPYRAHWDLGLSCPLTAGGVQTSIEWCVGALVKHHKWNSETVLQANLKAHLDTIYDVASKLNYQPSFAATLSSYESLFKSHAPLFYQRRPCEIYNGILDKLPSVGRLDALRLKRLARRAVTDPSDFRLAEFAFYAPTTVELATTRGGLWPERRDFPWGGPSSDPALRHKRLNSCEVSDLPKAASKWLHQMLG